MQLLAAAANALRTGRVAEAQQLCHQVLAENPANAEACNFLGVIAGSTGNHEAAADWMMRAAQAAPEQVLYRRNVLSALLTTRKFDDAVRVGQEALTQFPEDAKLLSLLGAAQGGIGKLNEGIATLEKSCALDSSWAASHFNLGELYRRAGRDDEALEQFRETLQANPNHADALNNLAGMQLDRGDFLDGLYSIKRLLELRPHSAQAFANLATALVAGGDVHQAVLALRNSIRIDPAEDRTKAQLASLLINIGDLDEAEEIVVQLRHSHSDNEILMAIHARIHERRGDLDKAWDLLEKITDDGVNEVEIALARATVLEQRGELDAAVSVLEKTLASDETLAIDGIGVQFMLGQLYDSLGRYDEAFEMYREGNKHRLEAFPDFGDKTELGHSLRRLVDVTSPEHYQRCHTSGLDTNRPIFIVGMPRSGTSLMEQILSSHPSVFGAGELSELGDEIRNTYQNDNRTSGPLEIIADDPSGDFGCLIPRDWENITAERLRAIGEGYLRAIDKLAPDAERVTDKMPFNYMMAGVIHKLFPNARIIHTRRNPIDTCLSCFFQNFTAGSQFAFDLERVGLYYKCYENLMKHWRETLQVPILEVDYEDLVADPESHVRRVLDYCDLAWDDNCLNTHKSKRVVRTASYQQVRKPIYKQSAGRWKNYERHLGPLFKALGIDHPVSTASRP